MVAQLGGWLARKGDGEPGAEALQAGLRKLMDMVRGWRLRFLQEAGYSRRSESAIK
jgi:hypothetical protein